MSLWSQLDPLKFCRTVYSDRNSWSFVKCSVAFCAGVLLIRSLEGKMATGDLVPNIQA